MQFRRQQVAVAGGAAALLGVLVLIVIGCGGVNPFLAAQFATTVAGVPRLGPGGVPPEQPAGPSTPTVSVCDVADNLRTLQMSLANGSQQFVRYSITFFASAGPGGWVCDDQVQNYINAGYTDAQISNNAVTIGCFVFPLTGGNRALAMRFGVDQVPEARLTPAPANATPQQFPVNVFVRRDNGSPFIPLPEFIIFGDGKPDFICTGNSLCTQRGFLYTSAANVPVGKAPDAQHIQGTGCKLALGRPQWELDKTLLDNTTQPFQYAAGGSIAAVVLDRSSDSLNDFRNQVVWTVLNANQQNVHFPEP